MKKFMIISAVLAVFLIVFAGSCSSDKMVKQDSKTMYTSQETEEDSGEDMQAQQDVQDMETDEDSGDNYNDGDDE